MSATVLSFHHQWQLVCISTFIEELVGCSSSVMTLDRPKIPSQGRFEYKLNTEPGGGAEVSSVVRQLELLSHVRIKVLLLDSKNQ